jgi:hypothetical protein
VAAHENDIRTDASKTIALQMCTASDEDAAFQGPVRTPSNPTPPRNAQERLLKMLETKKAKPPVRQLFQPVERLRSTNTDPASMNAAQPVNTDPLQMTSESDAATTPPRTPNVGYPDLQTFIEHLGTFDQSTIRVSVPTLDRPREF